VADHFTVLAGKQVDAVATSLPGPSLPVVFARGGRLLGRDDPVEFVLLRGSDVEHRLNVADGFKAG
jgi:hypothetical protein